jgi:hypothetical protein
MSIEDQFKAVRDELEKLLKDCEELVTKYTDIIGSHIPGSLKQALEEQWEMSVQHIELNLLVHYDKAQQKADHTRVIRWSDAEEITRDYEQKMSDAIFLGPVGIIVQVWINTGKFAVVLAETLASVMDTLIFLVSKWGWVAVFTHIRLIVWTTLTFIAVFFVLIVKMTFSFNALSRFTEGIIPVIKARDAQCQRLREKALPQYQQSERFRCYRQTRSLSGVEREQMQNWPPHDPYQPLPPVTLPPAPDEGAAVPEVEI